MGGGGGIEGRDASAGALRRREGEDGHLVGFFVLVRKARRELGMGRAKRLAASRGDMKGGSDVFRDAADEGGRWSRGEGVADIVCGRMRSAKKGERRTTAHR